METRIDKLVDSKEQFSFLRNKQDKVTLINEILDNSIKDFINIGEVKGEKVDNFLLEKEILFESMILYINSYFDIISNIIKIELDYSISNQKMDSLKYQAELNAYSNITKEIVEYWNLAEFKIIRNASNTLKHRKIIGVSFTIGSENQGVCLLPFSTRNFKFDNKIYHHEIYSYSVLLMRKIISIVNLIKEKT